MKIKEICINSKDYPKRLRNIYDPPKKLYVLGNFKRLREKSIAIVGSRKATEYGKKVAFQISQELTKENINIVSGLAIGIDTYAHLGAISIQNQAGTIAVLGSGIDVIYPKENIELARKIIQTGGCIVSEYPLSTKPNKINFPQRNRIISGLSDGVVVVEASEKSGSLITAEFGIEQGKEIFAVPGNIDNPLSKVTSNTIDEYIYFLKYSLNNSAKTRNRKLASLKKIFSYLDNQNLISINPTRNCCRAKVEKRQPRYLTLTESKQLLSETIKKDNKNTIRNYAITCIFLNCCIRLNELVLIDINDLKLDDRTIKIHGKGNLERIIYLDDAVIEAISEYLNVRPKLNKAYPDYNALFLSNRNKRISKRSVQEIIKNELNTIFEDNNKYHTHSLRHTGATLMYDENNTDILIIKEILGHKSINSTEIYTHVANKKVKELMLNFNILDLGGTVNEK